MPNPNDATPKTFMSRVRSLLGFKPKNPDPIPPEKDPDACVLALVYVMGPWTHWDGKTLPKPPKGKIPFEPVYTSLIFGLPVVAAYAGYSLEFLPIQNGAALSAIVLALPAAMFSRLIQGWLNRQIALQRCIELSKDGGLYDLLTKLSVRSGLPPSYFTRTTIYEMAMRYRNVFLPCYKQEYQDAVARKESELAAERERQRSAPGALRNDSPNRQFAYAPVAAGAASATYYEDQPENYMPTYNVNGTPMIANTGIDVMGNGYGHDIGHSGGGAWDGGGNFGGFND